MEGLTRDLVVGIAGSVIGAAIIGFISFGLRLTKTSQETWRQRSEKERSDWLSGDSAKRQRIFFVYLFSVLRLFIIGSILTGISSSISDLVVVDRYSPLTKVDYLTAVLDVSAVIFYLLTFATILRFTKLLRADL